MSDPSAPTQPVSNDGRFRRHLIRAVVASVIGIIAIAVVQSGAQETDYQKALFRSLGVGGITLTVVLYQMQRACSATGRRWPVPAGCLVVVLALVGLFRFESFSGEMMPRFSWRFGASKTPEMKSQPLIDNATDVDEAPVVPASIAVSTSDAPPTWLGFLGDDRDGVSAERGFEIPTSVDQVQRRWDIGIGEGWGSFAVWDDIAVTLEQRGEKECVTAYRMSDGQLLWLVDHEASHFQAMGGGGPRSTPSIVPPTAIESGLGNESGLVYAQGGTGVVFCLQLTDGKIVWQRDLIADAGWDKTESEKAILWGRAGSPLLVDDLCVLPMGGPDALSDEGRSLIALDAATGETRWTAGEQQISYASPMLMTLDGTRQIVSVNEANITGHDVTTGQTLWDFQWKGQSNSGANCAAAIPAGNDQFLIGKGYGGGSALVEVVRAEQSPDQWVANELWRSSRVLKTKFNHALVRDDVAYAISNGALQAVEIESGKRLWEQSRRGRFGQGQAVLVGDVLVVQSEDGEVVLVAADPDQYRELIRIPALEHKTWNIPTVVGNIVLVRNDRRAIALELPE